MGHAERTLLIVRHGEAEHMVGTDPLTGGWTDTPLTPTGREQARLTGLALASQGLPEPCSFWTSDLLRARQTADLIGVALGRTATPEAALREFNNGQAAGLRHSAADRFKAPLDGPVGAWRPYPGSENWFEFMARVNRFMDARLAVGNHLVVCHSGTAFNLVFRFLGLEESHVGKVYTELSPCGLIRLRVSPYGEQTIQCLNETAHLAGLQGP